MIQGIGATADRIFRCHPRSRRQDNPRRHPPWRQAGRIPLQCRHVGLRQGHRAAACGRIISANRRRRDLRRQAGADATARYRHCISGLQQGCCCHDEPLPATSRWRWRPRTSALPGWPPAYLFAGVMLPGVIGYLAALAMSVVEKRLLKWRWSGHW